MKKIFRSLFITAALILPIYLSICANTLCHATVPSTIDKVIYQGDGVSTSFAFGYNIYLPTDVGVYTTVTASSNTTQLTLNVNYTITLAAVSGTTGAYTATINLNAGSSPFGVLPVGTQLTILRSLPLTQLINISDYSSTPAATWNQAFDRAVILVQQMQEQINRAILAPVNSTAPSGYTLPNPVANAYIGWDPTGTFLTNLIATQPLNPSSSPTFAGLTLTGLNGILKARGSSSVTTASAGSDYSVPNGVETFTNKTYNTAGTGNVFQVNGSTLNATGILGTGSLILASSLTGNSGVLPQISGTGTSGHCVKFDASGNLIDNGSACSGGSGMTYPASPGITVSNASAWLTSISGTASQFVMGNATLQSLINSANVNWTDLNINAMLGTGGVNWPSMNSLAKLNSSGINWNNLNSIAMANNGMLNWQNITLLASGVDFAPPTATSSGAIQAANGSGGFSGISIGTGLSFSGGTLSNTQIGTQTLIKTDTLSSSTTDTITGLSAGVRYKIVIAWTQNTAASTFRMQFNGDTGSNYATSGLYVLAVGSPSPVAQFNNGTNISLTNTVQVAIGGMGTIEMNIYGSGNNVEVSGNGGADLFVNPNTYNGSSYTMAGKYTGSAGLSSLTVFPTSGSVTGTISVYQLN